MGGVQLCLFWQEFFLPCVLSAALLVPRLSPAYSWMTNELSFLKVHSGIRNKNPGGWEGGVCVCLCDTQLQPGSLNHKITADSRWAPQTGVTNSAWQKCEKRPQSAILFLSYGVQKCFCRTLWCYREVDLHCAYEMWSLHHFILLAMYEISPFQWSPEIWCFVTLTFDH